MAREGYIELQGKLHPLFSTILGMAHERGLKGIFTELVQVPNAENEYTAIVHAKVMMEGGGVFEGYGDASPKNTRMTTALIRMAETRAKGRALRDAVNVGQTMAEELPDNEPETAGARPMTETQRQGWSKQVAAVQANAGVPVCSVSGCGTILKPGQVTMCQQKFGGTLLCASHQGGAVGN